ncbi:MAG: hypothetical protein LUD39_01175 [Opitutae bacterium]|nr:hypothetical protein [Opitutae bacterium]
MPRGLNFPTTNPPHHQPNMKRNIFDHAFKRVVETPCEWLIAPLRNNDLFYFRRTFGCWSFYLGDMNVLLYVPAKTTPGDSYPEGLLIATTHENQPSLMAEFPQLAPHEFLKKWLCISASDENFEEVAKKLVALIVAGDPRIGVPGHTRARKKKRLPHHH